MLRFPFRTYRSLLVPARCSRRTVGHFPLSIHTDRALRRFLCVLRRGPLPFRLRRMSGGRLPAAFLRRSGASLSGRSFHGPYPLGPVRRPLPERGGPAGSGRQKNRTDRSRSLVRNAVCREGRSPVRKSECAKAPRGPRIAWSKRGSSVRHRAAPARRRTTCAFRFAFLGS